MGVEIKILISVILVISALVLIIILISKNKGEKTMNNSSEQSNNSQSSAKTAVYHKVSAKEGKDMLASDKSIILVDVRTPEEYSQGHVEGSVLIPDYDIHLLAPERLADKDAKIIVYCRSGARSRGAAMKLVSMNYTNVYDMGGIMAWPYGVVK